MPELRTYIAGLPTATTPPTSSDALMILQGGSLYQIAATFLFSLTTTKFFKDASAGTVNVNLAGYTDVIVGKTDATANTVTFSDTGGNVINIDPLSTKGETVHLILNGTTWYKIM